MGKKHNEGSDSARESIEIPKKLGFGRNSYELITMDSLQLEYLKSGKGAPEEVALLINEIKTRDPGAVVGVRDRKLVIGFSRAFEPVPYLNPRRREDATERERKRLEEAILRLIEAEAGDEELEDDALEERKKALVNVIKYRTEDEEEFVRMGGDLWIEDSQWRYVGTLLYCLVKDRYGHLPAEEQVKKLLAVIEYCD